MEETEVKHVQSQIERHDREDDQVHYSEATKKLAIGLLNIYQLPSEQVQKELNEVTGKQETLLCQMQVETKKLQESLEDIDLNETFQMIKVYQGKLTLMKKEMASIHERTFKLKKEALNKEQQREQEIRREQELIGKPVVS
ncbi:PREDICTED: biogenesis of lysosome-related organelles complex 1 subunit 6-like isoform X2 [Dufourea novaeangliae]|uniref:biogenesis of lysosome-related organelles complex 1 subunit 6-like isoform X2 n=1 Tax=Dufourea novaeangliae TaxID=178035 RepID=UPI0007673A73|nr:PREDICTED: biogenesis of lysosome-related organelles complex 1 subunit 6-like isoform X2 [Dufourea novaeangliae]